MAAAYNPPDQRGGRAIPTHVRHLREKIEHDPAAPTLVKTVGRFGYRLGE